MNWWKVAALVATGGLAVVGGLLYRLVRDLSDGWSDAMGYPRPRRWRRR